MRLSVSNIAWSAEHDEPMYQKLAAMGFSGLEIAPTRLFPQNPYCFLQEASVFKNRIQSVYGLSVCSMQSIWYGKNQRISGSEREYAELLKYTRDAANFAQAIGCSNLVFGCPRNRAVLSEKEYPINEMFLLEAAEIAQKKDVVISLEPNPTIYNTNYINTTREAIDVLHRLNHPNLKLNLDLGTMIENNESADVLCGNVPLINHVHISEPHLAAIRSHRIHFEVLELLCQNHYEGYVSIEMGNKGDLSTVEKAMRYVLDLSICSRS